MSTLSAALAVLRQWRFRLRGASRVVHHGEVPDDQDHADELIPEICKPLYESLISKGCLRLELEQPSTDPALRTLLELGFAQAMHSALLAAVSPDAAFERVLIRWLDHMTSIRRKTNSLHEQTVVLQHHFLRLRGSDGPSACHVIVEKAQVGALYRSLNRAAERQTCTWATGPYRETTPDLPQPADFSRYAALAYVPPDSKLLDRGGTSRCIYDAEFIAQMPGLAERGFADGEDVRIRNAKLPMKLLIVDDHTALVPLGPYGHPALLVRTAPLVALFQHFFDVVWNAATPYEPDARKRRAAKASRAGGKMLQLMADGLKDEAIARQCGMSVKTVRRHIAQLMAELGARNRFAAGVAAVRRGWID